MRHGLAGTYPDIELQPPSGRRTRPIDYRRFLQETSLEVLAFDQSAAQWMGREHARLRKAGHTPPYRDLQIAAVAAVNDLTVVTRNTADFELIHGVRLENWFEQRIRTCN